MYYWFFDKEATMTPDQNHTTGTEEEKSASTSLRNAMFWRVKAQLRSFRTITARQYNEIVDTALRDAQAAARELSNLYPGIESHQNAGWKAFDCFDQVAAKAASPGQTPPPQPQAPTGPPPDTRQQPGNDLDNLGKDMEKGLRDIGGAIVSFFGEKKK